MKTKISLLLSAGLLMSGCASVQSVSLTPIPAKRDKVVRAEATRFIILGFNFDNNYVDQIHQSFRAQCPGGVISGILTKDEVISYFLAHRRKVTATGFCNQASQAKVTGKRGTASEGSAEAMTEAMTDEMLGL